MRHFRAGFPATVLLAALAVIVAALLLPAPAHADIGADDKAFRAARKAAISARLGVGGPSDSHGAYITYRNRPCIGADFSDDNKRLGCQTAFR